MIDRREDRRDRRRSSAWFSSSRFSASVSTIACAPVAGDLVVPVRDVLVDRDRRKRRGIDLVRDPVEDRRRVSVEDDPAGRRAGDDDAGADDEDGDDDEPDPAGATDAFRRLACRRSRGVSRTGRSRPPPTAVPARAGRGSGRPRRRRPDPPAARPWCPNSSVCGAMQERAGDGDEEAEHDPPDLPSRHRLRVRDHEEQEDQHLGRGDDHPPEVEPADGRERPVRGHAVARRRRGCRRRSARRDPEGRGEAEQVQPPRDQQPAADDHGVGQRSSRRSAAPTRSRAARRACCRARRRPRPARCWTG